MSEYSTNVIAESIYSMVDIIDHRVDMNQAVLCNNAWTVNHKGDWRQKQITKGWELCVSWKDQSIAWIPQKDLKESNLVQVAEYAMSNGIGNEPAFA